MKQRRLPKQLSSPIHPASREKNQAFEQSVESQHCPYPKINVLFTEEHGYILTGCKHDLCSHIQQSFFPPNLGKKCLFTSLNHTLLQSMEMKVAENWQHDWMTESAETLQQPTQIETTNGCKHSDTNLTFSDISKKTTVNSGQTCAANPCCCRSRAIKDFSLKMLQIMPYKVKVLAPTSCKCCKWEIQGPQSCKYNAGQQFWCLLDLNFMGVPRSIWKKAGEIEQNHWGSVAAVRQSTRSNYASTYATPFNPRTEQWDLETYSFDMLDMLHIFWKYWHAANAAHAKKGEVRVVRQLDLDRRDFGEGLVHKRQKHSF